MSFSVTASSTRLGLGDDGTAVAVFTVTNELGRDVRVRALVRVDDDAHEPWFTVRGETERVLAEDGVESYEVEVRPPVDAPPGVHSFGLLVMDVDDPDETWAEGPRVEVEIVEGRAEKAAKTPFPWWIVGVGAGALVLVVGLVTFFVVRHRRHARAELEAQIGRACEVPEAKGICVEGKKELRDDQLVCVSVASPASQEQCNGLDDDCDGEVDEGAALDPSCVAERAVGLCKEGVPRCEDGETVCDPGTPGEEICANEVDEDCDGQLNNGCTVAEGFPCGVIGAKGPCAEGKYERVDGKLVCVSPSVPEPETCNGVDDDCDGVTDEDVELSPSCTASAKGECRKGTPACRDGREVCDPGTPSKETCGDETDEDCDGLLNDGCPTKVLVRDFPLTCVVGTVKKTIGEQCPQGHVRHACTVSSNPKGLGTSTSWVGSVSDCRCEVSCEGKGLGDIGTVTFSVVAKLEVEPGG